MQLREKLRRLQAMPHPDLVRLASQHSDFENFKHWNPDLPQAKLTRFALEAKLEPPQAEPLWTLACSCGLRTTSAYVHYYHECKKES